MDDLLLIRFIQDKVTVDEARIVLRWIEKSDTNKSYYAHLQMIYAATEINHCNASNAEAIKKILEQIHPHRTIPIYAYIAAACAVVAIILVAVWLPKKTDKHPNYEALIHGIQPSREITIRTNKGNSIQLVDSSATVTYTNKNIVINDTLILAKDTITELNTINVPYGKRSKLILADGTTVHLNSGSTLIYPSDFSDDTREVFLEGEAYFEVSHDDSHRFIVQTLYRSVEVYGTKFNVSSDRELQQFEVVLVEGSVAVTAEGKDDKRELIPNQYYGYYAMNDFQEIKNVDVSEYISWIKGNLLFHKEPLYKAIYRLEKIYNIKIKVTDPKYLDYLVSGNLNIKESAEATVKNLMLAVAPEGSDKDHIIYSIAKN